MKKNSFLKLTLEQFTPEWAAKLTLSCIFVSLTLVVSFLVYCFFKKIGFSSEMAMLLVILLNVISKNEKVE